MSLLEQNAQIYLTGINFKMIKTCKHCNKEFEKRNKRTQYCSRVCGYASKERSEKIRKTASREPINLNCLNCGNDFKVRPCMSKKRLYCSLTCVYKSEEYRAKRAEIGRKICSGKMGKNHPAYIKDRSLIKISDRHSADALYYEWRNKVYLRDNWKCKIGNQDCDGRIEAHHILPWRDYPELRYNENNGITLCHSHHPRKYEDEKRLTPYFQELVLISSKK